MPEAPDTGASQSSQGGSQPTASAGAAQPAAAKSPPTQPNGSAAAPSPQTDAAAAPAAVKVERPAYVPETFWDPSAGKVKDKEFGEHLNELSAFKAAEDSKRLSRPQKPEEYQAALPQDFTMPEGIEFKFNDGDPLIAQARSAAHEMGLTQDQFSKMLGIYAGTRVQETQAFANAKTTEVAKLGPSGPARVTAVTTFLTSRLGEAGAKPLIDSIWTADAVKSYEALIQRVSSQGAGSFSNAHREAPETMTDEKYNAMSFRDRMDYVRSQRANGTKVA